MAEAKIQSFAAQTNGMIYYQALVNHYEGVGVHVVDITNVESTLKGLFYSGEKRPLMWWEEFKK